MASRMATKGMAVACVAGIGIAVSGMASAAPKTKGDQQMRSVHGTARQTQSGMEQQEPAMDSMDVRKAVQGKNSGDKY